MDTPEPPGALSESFDFRARGSILYIAALRAAEEMAIRCKDSAFATKCRAVIQRSANSIPESMWHGNMFRDSAAPAESKRSPDLVAADASTLLGQTWAFQLGLGPLLDDGKIRTALDTVWKATDPKSAIDGVPAPELHQSTALMIWEGMVERATALELAEYAALSADNVHNDLDSGDHSVCSMAAYGVFLALCGFEYDGPAGILGFAPRLGAEEFRAAFTGAEGWGTIAQKRTPIVGANGAPNEAGAQTNSVIVKHGTLTLNELRVVLPEGCKPKSASAKAAGEDIALGSLITEGSRVRVPLAKPLTLTENKQLTIRIEYNK
jgi:hypothetical protein